MRAEESERAEESAPALPELLELPLERAPAAPRERAPVAPAQW